MERGERRASSSHMKEPTRSFATLAFANKTFPRTETKTNNTQPTNTMKLKNYILPALCAVAALSQTSRAALQATLPEFKSKQELAQKRAALSATHSITQSGAFYTGKPFEAGRESYIFKYRSYDAELNRWTTQDPTGFRDGANISSYCINGVTISLDPDGAKRVLVEEDFKLSVPGSAGYGAAGLAGTLAGAGLGAAGTEAGPLGIAIGAAVGFFGGTGAYFTGTYNSWGNNIDSTYVVGANGVGGTSINQVYAEVSDSATLRSQSYTITYVSKDWSMGATQLTFTADVYSAKVYVWE